MKFIIKLIIVTILLKIPFFRLIIAQVPSGITTTVPTLFTSTSCTTGGNVTAGIGITAKGAVYAKTSNPTTANSVTNDVTGTGSFTSQLTGLDSGSVYYLQAYATNASGTSWGRQRMFLPTEWPAGIYTIRAKAVLANGDVIVRSIKMIQN